MLLKAEFHLDLDVDNYVEAARHQRTIEAFVAEIREAYPQAEANIRARRKRGGGSADGGAEHG